MARFEQWNLNQRATNIILWLHFYLCPRQKISQCSVGWSMVIWQIKWSLMKYSSYFMANSLVFSHFHGHITSGGDGFGCCSTELLPAESSLEVRTSGLRWADPSTSVPFQDHWRLIHRPKIGTPDSLAPASVGKHKHGKLEMLYIYIYIITYIYIYGKNI